MTLKVVIVGGGIIGVGSAYCLIQRFPDLEITLMSDAFSPDTTGDGSAGLWTPYLLGDTPVELIKKWSSETLNFFKKLWHSGQGGALGVSLIPVIVYGSTDSAPPMGAFGLHKLSKEELRRLRFPETMNGYSYTTFTCEPKKILPHFLEEFKRLGGIVVERHVENLKELLVDFDIVVHCTGLRASRLTIDESLHPIRGQVHRVKAPHIFHTFMNMDTGGYLIPNQDTLVLGGTHQENDWNLKISQKDKESILTRCTEIVPSVKDAIVINDWVGLRPGRSTVRLDYEKLIGRNGKVGLVIHNYGHGGAGVTLFWGCALDVANILEEAIQLSGN